MKSLGLLLPLLCAACGFKASPADTPPDSNGGTPGSGGVVDASTPDGHVTPPAIDAQVCFGKGVVQFCLTTAPTTDKTLQTTSFNTDGGSCTQTFQQANGPDLCVVAFKNLTVSGTVTATGNRALVLLGTETVTIDGNGTVDVSSRSNNPGRRGAAANFAACPAVGRGTSDSGGAGGGAGGSFGTQGGNGALGDKNNSGPPAGSAPGAMAGAAQTNPAVLRGGCAGSAGGNGSVDPNKAGGAGGDGGGAVFVIAGQTITIAGNVFASGAGGNANGNGAEEGGGGGGAGGMIGLDAPTLNITGKVVANGGGGGGGGTTDRGGSGGGDGTTDNWNAQADHGTGGFNPQAGSGGDGASGAALNQTNNLTPADNDGGGGGGGGGLGVIACWGTITGGATMSPAPVTH